MPNISISVEGKPIQQVDRMVYLGYMATEDGKCDKEIKRRIGIARTAFESMAKILTSRNISIELRSRITKCYIWSTLLYGAETWTLTKVIALGFLGRVINTECFISVGIIPLEEAPVSMASRSADDENDSNPSGRSSSESAFLTKVTSDKLEAFEMWLWRSMLRISWKERKTNGEVSHKMKAKISLFNIIKKGNVNIFDI